MQASLFNLISLLALFCAFNFAYVGSARFRMLFSDGILKLQKLLAEIPPLASHLLLLDLNNKLHKKLISKYKLKNVYEDILLKRDKNSKFEVIYIELFFITGIFGVFQIMLISLDGTINEHTILALISYLYLSILVIISYIFVSGFTDRNTANPLIRPIQNVMQSITVFLIAIAICLLIYFCLNFFEIEPPYFSKNVCIILSCIIGFLPYTLFLIRAFFHIRSNKKTYKYCKNLASNEIDIDRAFDQIMQKRYFKNNNL
ncbi:MAG: hypothetical protein JNM71_05160 [Flavobacterium lindanitolerans]|uniref:hypothetical protein n=1 Tax=Flavobacterium lindanitolerans TaxID=428988 RepID=UPI001A440213|nr:hypothetical protein [Flavobacterium lindanitolerans]MBL7867387.1 hypothetical protein [Flavobacterium lindanitolerans]